MAASEASSASASGPPDQDLAGVAGRVARGARTASTASNAASEAGSAVRTTSSTARPVALAGRLDGADPVDALDRRADLVDPVGGGDDGRGLGAAGREVLGEHLLAGHRLGLLEELLGLGEPDLQAEHGYGERDERQPADDGHGDGARGHPARDLGPHAGAGGVLVAEVRHERPEQPAAGAGHGGGQDEQGVERRR